MPFCKSFYPIRQADRLPDTTCLPPIVFAVAHIASSGAAFRPVLDDQRAAERQGSSTGGRIVSCESDGTAQIGVVAPFQGLPAACITYRAATKCLPPSSVACPIDLLTWLIF